MSRAGDKRDFNFSARRLKDDRPVATHGGADSITLAPVAFEAVRSF
jgi:hypothetical protein